MNKEGLLGLCDDAAFVLQELEQNKQAQHLLGSLWEQIKSVESMLDQLENVMKGKYEENILNFEEGIAEEISEIVSEFAELKNKLYSVHEKVEGLALSPYQNLSPAVSEALKTLSLTRVPMISVNNRLTELEQRVAEISNTSG